MSILSRVRSEYAYLAGALRTLKRVTAIAKNTEHTFPDLVESLAEKFGDRPALLSDIESLTYRQYDRRANQYARWAQANGVAKGDKVALLMHGRPEFIVAWLGIIRAGGVCALQNTNLKGRALAHCLNIVSPKHVIVGSDLVDVLDSTKEHLTCAPQVWIKDGDKVVKAEGGKAASATPRPLDPALAEFSDAPLSEAERPKLTINDPALYIYTSGTTGLPKAANINHYRVQAIMHGFSAAMAATEHDRMYVSLPLYHSVGGLLAIGAVLTVGGSAVIRAHFSAREFWDDIVRYECTLFQYIGELCRYLLNSPTNPNERKHKIRLCCGNGLRPDVWRQFKQRFALPQILEFYGATEGNVVLFNFDGKEGSIGRIPKWAERRFVTEVVRFDYDTEQPMRDADGRCIKCGPHEVGEVIGKILNDPTRPSQRFEGYADDGATRTKILENVFEDGDRWFRTGDLMRKDELGYFYFVDRIGDTFRWKGENVATSEVAESLTSVPGVLEANVYGVVVPGHDGRAGMASLVVGEGFDPKALRKHVHGELPPYARPLFLRLQREIEITSTFKHRKVDLVKQGFDPSVISDELYFDHPDKEAYVQLDAALYNVIQEGEIRI